MPRRRPVELNISHERWLVSYADFITLLFAFFVVMYSISQVSESKYRVLSETLSTAFDQAAPQSPNLIQVGSPSLSSDPSVIEGRPQTEAGIPGDGAFDKTADLPQLSDLFEDEFADLIDDELIQVHSNELWLEVELQSGILFDSADAEPSAQAESIFADVAKLLEEYNNPIQVEGFTDNIPINNNHYPSNWELSSARAAAVVKLLARDGIEPDRLSAVGYGEFQPVADNSTDEGRSKNRRVVLMIARQRVERPNVRNTEEISRAVNPPLVETSEPFPQPGLSQALSAEAESLDELLGAKTDELDENIETGEDAGEGAVSEGERDRLAPLGDINPVELEGGGLLFSSDPDLPRK